MKGIEIRNAFVHGELRGFIAIQFQHGFHSGNVPVIDVAVGDDVDQLAGLQGR